MIKYVCCISNGSVPAFTPYNVTSYTNIDNYMVSAGGTCNLGSTSAPWNAVYAKNYYDEYGNKISTGGGQLVLKLMELHVVLDSRIITLQRKIGWLVKDI